MPTNGSRPNDAACECEVISTAMRRLADAVDELHRRGRKHDADYILALLEAGLSLHLEHARKGALR